ncbi:pentapeptide repeat-containing protein [Proteus vulgaris]|nr:pentapeptide repeat-containing protein [Proteus vulgaris]
MNYIYLYFKSRIMSSSVAAVEFAKRHPSLSNIQFAEKLLRIKSTSEKFKKCSGDKTFQNEKLNKYTSLEDKIKEIRNDYINKKRGIIKLTGSSTPFKRPYDFSNENLIGVDLKNKDLRKANFTSSYIIDENQKKKGADFSGSNLKGVDLTQTKLNGSIFINSDLTGAKVYLSDANYSNAKLDDAEIKLSDGFLFLSLLDGSVSYHTLFNTINSIDDKYYKIKISLMKRIIVMMGSTIKSKDDKIIADLIIDNVLSKEYYLDDKEIYKDTKYLFRVKYSDNYFDGNLFKNEFFKRNLSFCLDVVSQLYKDEQSYNILKRRCYNFMITNNNEFIELMALSLYHENKDIQEKARRLYKKYLDLKYVKPFVEKEDFGNGNHEVDWSKKDYNNYILLSDNKYYSNNIDPDDVNAIIISHENLTNMLFSHSTEHEIMWNNFSLYIDDEKKYMDKINYYDLFNNDFKIFKNNYNKNLNKVMCYKILPMLNLGDFYNQFYFAFIGNAIIPEQMLVSIEVKKKLDDIFNKFLVLPNKNIKYHLLKEEHYQELCQSLEIESLNNEEKAKYLLSLATLFVKYSSSAVFGTEKKSPKTLRSYAYALLCKASELNVDLMNNSFDDWKDELLGLGNVSTYTDVLFSKMSSYMKKNFNNIYNVIMPPHWR